MKDSNYSRRSFLSGVLATGITGSLSSGFFSSCTPHGRDNSDFSYKKRDLNELSLNYSFNWPDIFSHAKHKTAINELDIEQRLVSFPVEWLENVNWLSTPINTEKSRAPLNQIADDFLLGKENTLGKHQPPIENAIPVD